MPTLTGIFIDKVVMLLSLSDEDATNLVSVLRDECRDHIDRLHGYYRNYRGLRYQYTFGLPLGNDGISECKIFLIHNSRSIPNVRIEFNPSKFNEEWNEVLWIKLAQWFPFEHYSYLMNAVVSRLDIATDVHPVSLESILVTAPKFRVSTIRNGAGGHLQSITLGSNESDNQIKLYDKYAEQESRGRGGIQRDTVRIEYRNSTGIPIASLYDVHNVLTQIRIINAIDIQDLPLRDSDKFHFLDSVRFRGLHAALNLIHPPRTKRETLQWLQSAFSTDWWEPERIWQGYDGALDRLHIPEDLVRQR